MTSEDGLPGGTRTPDLRLRRPLLYPVELRADKKGPETMMVGPFRMNGRSERIRTFDPLVPNQMRYQTALRSDKPHILMRDQWKSEKLMKKFFRISIELDSKSYLMDRLGIKNRA